MYFRLAIILFLFQIYSCREKSSRSLFTLVSPDHTGIDFNNIVQENDSFNIFTYQYLYNGGGVALGDVNNDGKTDVFLTGNMVPNRLYLNEGNLRFKDITATAGVAGRKQWKTGTCMVDVNGDGLLDIYVCYSGPGTDAERSNELYINNGVKNGTVQFTERAAAYGLDAPGTFTTQVVFFDMDRDGDLDLFMVNHADMFYNSFFNTSKLRMLRHPKFGNRLYKNDDGHFTDISSSAGIHGSGLNFGLSAGVSDLNNDNWLDLYVTNDYNEQDFMYLNNHDNSFREVLKSSMGHLSKFSMGSDIADYNNDLRPDVITLDMLPEDNKRQKLLKGADNFDVYQLLADSGFHYQDMRNMLQMNVAMKDSAPVFSEVGQLAGISNTDWSWAPLFCDLNNDGWKDLYITNGYLRDFTNMDFLTYTFQEETAAAKAKGTAVNNWELVKKMPSTKISNYCYSSNKDLTFTNQTVSWGLHKPSISTGAAYADLDNDGDLDLVVNNSNDPVSVFENHSDAVLSNHYIRIRLNGDSLNRFAFGAKVILQTDSGTQMQELNPVRGFQSSVEPVVHFGLGTEKNIRSLKVLWPNGGQTLLHNLPADTTITLNAAGVQENQKLQESSTPWFSDVTATSGLVFAHKETRYIDFKTQSLLPYQVSKIGPFLTKGDVNGDGLEDVIIGGNYLAPARLFQQQANGRFMLVASQPWQYSVGAKDGGILLFDADGDRDLDLYMVRGGGELPAGNSVYQDQLYTNDGKGKFQLAENSLPAMLSNGSCIAADDYDKDGDVDLFVGGTSIPGRFPETDFSYLLRNETTTSRIRFEYASEQPDKTLRHPGMVTSAVWTDVNGDGWNYLIVAGAFMPITIYENQKGKLTNATQQYGLEKTNGLWSKLLAADMDSDGDIDLVAGNIGLNSQFRASEKQPVTLCYGDFDNNGSVDPLFCYYIDGRQWPLASLDELAGQIPSVRKKFLRYEQYASATVEDIIGPQQAEKAQNVYAYNLASCYLENIGNKSFRVKQLPLAAQFSRVNGIIVHDVDEDGKSDLLLHGNDFSWRAQLGNMDASFGVVCRSDGAGNFKAFPVSHTGIIATGAVQDMTLISNDNEKFIVITKNNAAVEIRRVNK